MLSRRRQLKIFQWLTAFGTLYLGRMSATSIAFGAGGAITAAIVAVLLFRWGVPENDVRDELLVRFAEFYAALSTLVGWTLINAFVAVAGAGKLIRDEGHWFEDQFVLHRPKLAATLKTSVGKPLAISNYKIPFVPGGVLVRYTAEISPPNTYWQANLGINVHTMPRPAGAPRTLGLTGEARLARDKTVALTVTPTNTAADEVIARFWIEAWQI
ncbi:hypothetical protein L5876_02250 [Hyphobacterium sp. SN044]|uniref:hypothetical protein n=1 Tax=Hyphobacterium sp. SN044 TaxID=2912575 RepID=UPI001F1E9D05|nr:hypothetical protein [Hyphobacterium sp. SN044]MCF8878629.1 hypothetical protein [Hyphobacterium sp. SN044]